MRRLLAQGETLVTTRFNVAELYVGIEQSRDPFGEQQHVAEASGDMEILEFDGVAARAFARIQARLRAIGRPVGDMDVLIAAVALTSGESLVTRNGRHYMNMPGLAVIEYGTTP